MGIDGVRSRGPFVSQSGAESSFVGLRNRLLDAGIVAVSLRTSSATRWTHLVGKRHRSKTSTLAVWSVAGNAEPFEHLSEHRALVNEHTVAAGGPIRVWLLGVGHGHKSVLAEVAVDVTWVEPELDESPL